MVLIAIINSELKMKYNTWWNDRRRSFLLPPLYASHDHVWEHIDVECVGCAICGVVHICGHPNNIIPCRKEQQTDSSIVCTLTGVVLLQNSLFDSNVTYSDFAKNRGASRGGPHVNHARIVLTDEVEHMWKLCVDVGNLLMTSKRACMARETEHKSYVRKVSTCFARHLKRNRNAYEEYNLVDALESTMNCVKNTRLPPDIITYPPIQHFAPMIREIVELVMCLELPKPYQPKTNNEKMLNLVIALYYIAIDGITANKHVFLTQCLHLKPILPLQLLLWPIFKLQPKIITEGENVVKMCIKNLTPSQIRNHGMVSVCLKKTYCLFKDFTHQCTCPEI